MLAFFSHRVYKIGYFQQVIWHALLFAILLFPINSVHIRIEFNLTYILALLVWFIFTTINLDARSLRVDVSRIRSNLRHPLPSSRVWWMNETSVCTSRSHILANIFNYQLINCNNMENYVHEVKVNASDWREASFIEQLLSSVWSRIRVPILCLLFLSLCNLHIIIFVIIVDFKSICAVPLQMYVMPSFTAVHCRERVRYTKHPHTWVRSCTQHFSLFLLFCSTRLKQTSTIRPLNVVCFVLFP